MALARLSLPLDALAPLPRRVEHLLADAAVRIEHFMERQKDDPVAGFVPSDFPLVHHALRVLRDVHAPLLPGNAFCEWGSGIGVIACMAAMLGYDSVGIEIDARLVEAARELACDHQINVQFVQGSYVPHGIHPPDDFGENHVVTMQDGVPAYDELGLDPEDFDCIFAYPWPGEDDVVSTIFDECAARGAVLLTYHGQDGVLARRKVR
jgi:hypothetical protein